MRFTGRICARACNPYTVATDNKTEPGRGDRRPARQTNDHRVGTALDHLDRAGAAGADPAAVVHVEILLEPRVEDRADDVHLPQVDVVEAAVAHLVRDEVGKVGQEELRVLHVLQLEELVFFSGR